MSGAHAFWTSESGAQSRAVFAAEGIRCAACTRAIERAVRALAGIERVNVNVATARVSVDWRPAETDLPEILKAVDAAGFKTVPFAGEAAEAAFLRERRTALKRIGLAGIGMMQVMMYALGVTIAKPGDMDPAMADYLRLVAMLIATPVLFYSGAPFLRGAWQSIRRRALGMDLPVALALVLAYAASVLNTLRGSGQTYFDSVTMFIFFLSAGRYVEMTVRQRSLSTSEALARSLPASANRLRSDGATERIPIHDITVGDRLSIPKGAVIPVDAELAAGTAYVDESLITGEATPSRRQIGAVLLGGSVNTGDALCVVARQTVDRSALSSIVALLERAQSVRPGITTAADRTAAWFIAAILLIAALVAAIWAIVDPARAFSAALAVLVVTCPCALSLAAPVAVAAATTRLARLGLLVTRADALERLASVDTVVFDKTGTLTSGNMAVANVTIGQGFERAQVFEIAAALERASTHPIAQYFAQYANSAVVAEDVSEVTGQGMAGRVNGERWRLGRPGFVATQASNDALCLGNERGLVATFDFIEEIRPTAREALAALRGLNISLIVASGDRSESVARVARALDIGHADGRLDPTQKVAKLHELQRQGRNTLMIGDGVNDGPVLASATVSCAMGQGSAVAHAAADLVLLNDSLAAVAQGIETARRMRGVIRQNLRWALVYNFAAVPLAALGLVPPWLAAIGMSLSSLAVVLNAGRLAGARRRT